MGLTVRSLSYNSLQEKVQITIAGQLDGRRIHIELEFPFQSIEPLLLRENRATALLEAQEILRAASVVPLPSRFQRQCEPLGSQAALSSDARWARPLRSYRKRKLDLLGDRAQT